MRELRLTVSGMACESCADRVERAVRSVPDVEEVTVHLDPADGHGEVLVKTLGEPSREALTGAVEEAGYAVEGTSR